MSSTNFTKDVSIVSSSEIVEQWAQVAGDSIPYLAAGDSDRRVLLAHGAGSNRKTWTQVMSALSPRSRVVAPDLIGFGDAPRGDFAYTPEYMADFLAGFMDAVGIERAALVGHSMGGRVCLEVARRHPERVSALILEAPMGFGEVSRPGRMFSMARWWVSRLLGLKSPYPRLDFPIIESETAGFGSLACETLMIWGSRDLYFPAEHGLRALEIIPNSRLEVYDGVGHGVHRSFPARFNADAREFLAGIQ